MNKTEIFKLESKELLSYIDSIRKDKKLTYKQIAATTGFNHNNISRMMNVKYSPLLHNVIALADAVGCDVKIIKRTE